MVELYITIIVGWTDGENSVFWVHKSRGGPCRLYSRGEVHKDSRALTPILASTAFAVGAGTNLMISAIHQMVRNCISPMLLGGQMGKIVFFWVHKSKRKAHASTVISESARISRALTPILASTALVHDNPDDLGDASWWCGTVYHLSLLVLDRWENSAFGCTQSKRKAHAGTVIGEVHKTRVR
jgi:hypothetical protein